MQVLQVLGATDGAVVAGVGGFVVLIWILALALSVFWLWMLVDCLTSSMPTNEKLLWFVVIFFTHILGAVLYYFMVRSGRRTGIV